MKGWNNETKTKFGTQIFVEQKKCSTKRWCTLFLCGASKIRNIKLKLEYVVLTMQNIVNKVTRIANEIICEDYQKSTVNSFVFNGYELMLAWVKVTSDLPRKYLIAIGSENEIGEGYRMLCVNRSVRKGRLPILRGRVVCVYNERNFPWSHGVKHAHLHSPYTKVLTQNALLVLSVFRIVVTADVRGTLSTQPCS